MKNGRLGTLCAFACFGIVFVGSQSCRAQSSQSPQIFVINIQNAISSTEDGRKAFEALEHKFDGKRTDLKAKSEELDRLKRQYEAQGSKLNDDTRASLSGQINTKQRVLSRVQEDVQAEFNEQQSEIVQRILRRLAPVIDKYAKEKGAGLVIDNSKPWPDWPTVWVSASSDITKTVVELYNAGSASAGSPAPK
jgi:Skp family chaperone for outer membrane proteins